MSGKIYVLSENFRSFSKGTEFTQVSKYGDSHIYAAKLEEKNVRYRPETIEVTEKELYEYFETICQIISN